MISGKNCVLNDLSFRNVTKFDSASQEKVMFLSVQYCKKNKLVYSPSTDIYKFLYQL